MDRKEQVIKAIRMQGPDYVPLFYVNGDRSLSDIIMIDVVRHFEGPDRGTSEWGFHWERYDETMGQPKEEVIKTWDDIDTMKVPDAYDEKRFSEVKRMMTRYGNRYYIASLALSGFTIMSALRGFSNSMEDFFFNPDKMEGLADTVFQFEEEVIVQLKKHYFNAVALYDDWGTQTNLLIPPELWREFFKPRYKKQIDLAHNSGLEVYFHSCGYIEEIIPDLIEIGVDLLNLGQPNLFDIEKLGSEFGGRVCFVCPVSYQTTAISGSEPDIYQTVEQYVKHLGSFDGGLIGYVEEYESIGLSKKNYESCVSAFRELGVYD